LDLFCGEKNGKVNKRIKIAFTGPESSGKTTLAKQIAQKFKATYCEEFARTFLVGKTSYTQKDLDLIAKGQAKSWDVKTDFLVADTEITVVCIWSLYKYGTISNEISSLFSQQQFDLLFLCRPDIPWQFDVLRENPENRDELFDLYHSFLLENKQNFVVIEGNEQQRLSIVETAIATLLKK
jgi:nicotinamide riboside kinase